MQVSSPVVMSFTKIKRGIAQAHSVGFVRRPGHARVCVAAEAAKSICMQSWPCKLIVSFA